MALTKIKASSIDSIPVVVMDDISFQFDGDKTVFGLTLDYANIYTKMGYTIVDSKDLDVSINFYPISPYVRQATYPWITTFDSYKGFRVSGDNILFYQAPSPGSHCSIIFRNRSQTAQQRRYPFHPGTIALGD
jgi:hypothetical protein